MNKKLLFIYIFRLILLCLFITPIHIKYRDGIIFSHIFSTEGEILIGRFFLYFFLWSFILLIIYFQIKNNNPQKGKNSN